MKIFGRVLGGLRQLRRSPKWQGDSLKKRVLTRWSVPWSLDMTVCGLCGLEACSVGTTAAFKWYSSSVVSSDPGVYYGLQLLSYCVSSGMKLGSLYGLCHIYRPPPDVFHWQFSRTSFSYGLVGLSLFGGAAIMFSSHLTSFEEYAENDKVKLSMMPFCTNLAAVFTVVQVNVAAVVEEIVYRGFLLTSLTKWVATPTALLLSSVAFGLSHVGAHGFNLSVFPQHFFFGLFSGAAYLYSRNLCAPILVHSVYNSAMFVYLLLEFKRVCPNGFDEQDLIRLSGSKSVTRSLTNSSSAAATSALKPSSSSKIKGKKPLKAPEKKS